ncbi:MAG TPA: undecaprenyl-diphosphate phosphatase, partial [Deinococcales bacterium]|nr:undecaprenyl-diphosphate phosphatase [Deinococcales bacterium]
LRLVISILDAAILGIVEGLTEFLPISSTGHLIVAGKLLGVEAGGTMEIVIQLGAVLAVIWFYRTDLLERAAAVRDSQVARSFWLKLLLAFVPAGIIGFLFGDEIKAALFSPTVVAISLIAGGIVLYLIDRRPIASDSPDISVVGDRFVERDGARGTGGLDAITPRQALTVGLAQLLALIPGVSRSASSIMGGLASGLDRETATAFSFYLAIITLGSAGLYDFARNASDIVESGSGLAYIVGIVFAFITALLAVGWLLRFIARNNFTGFAVYRVIAGLAILGLVWAGVL